MSLTVACLGLSTLGPMILLFGSYLLALSDCVSSIGTLYGFYYFLFGHGVDDFDLRRGVVNKFFLVYQRNTYKLSVIFGSSAWIFSIDVCHNCEPAICAIVFKLLIESEFV